MPARSSCACRSSTSERSAGRVLPRGPDAGRGAQPVARMQPRRGHTFHGDEELLRRLLMNPLDNAIRYTPPGGTVSAALEANGVGLRLRVSDTGVGIPAEDARHVFERFYRASSSRLARMWRVRSGPGHRQMDRREPPGRGRVYQPTRRGSTFTVALPPLVPISDCPDDSSSVHVPDFTGESLHAANSPTGAWPWPCAMRRIGPNSASTAHPNPARRRGARPRQQPATALRQSGRPHRA
jgi:hypothetical protein